MVIKMKKIFGLRYLEKTKQDKVLSGGVTKTQQAIMTYCTRTPQIDGYSSDNEYSYNQYAWGNY